MFIYYVALFNTKHEAYVLTVVGMGPSWPCIEHVFSGVTAHLETAIFNVCETVNLGV